MFFPQAGKGPSERGILAGRGPANAWAGFYRSPLAAWRSSCAGLFPGQKSSRRMPAGCLWDRLIRFRLGREGTEEFRSCAPNLPHEAVLGNGSVIVQDMPSGLIVSRQIVVMRRHISHSRARAPRPAADVRKPDRSEWPAKSFGSSPTRRALALTTLTTV